MVLVNDSNVDIPLIKVVLIVKEFPKVFPYDLPESLSLEIDFDIDVLLDTHSISVPP